MFENFTERCRKVISLSRQEAQRLGGEYIGTEHLLLGILQEGGGVAARVLKNQDIDFQLVRREVERLMGGRDIAKDLLVQLPFSPLAKRTIELAGEAASALGHAVVGTEHLLLGLTQGTEGIAATILAALKLDYAKTRDLVLDILTHGPGPKRAPDKPETSTLVDRNLLEAASAYRALTDRPELQDRIARLLQQGRSIALVGPRAVGKTSLVLALARYEAGTLTYWSIDHRIFDESHGSRRSMPKRPGAVCFVPEGELVTASRSMVPDLLDERRRAGERLILEFRDGGFEDYAKRNADLVREFEVVTVAPPDAAECRRLLEEARTNVQRGTGFAIDDDALTQVDRLARERWPKMVAPWATLITMWKAAVIQGESASRGDLKRLEQDIAELEKDGKTNEAELLKRHVEGLRGVGQRLSLESVRQAISELADKPSAHF